METNVLRTPFCFVCACVSWAYTWPWAYVEHGRFFGLKVLTCRTWGIYRHSRYFGMGVITDKYRIHACVMFCLCTLVCLLNYQTLHLICYITQSSAENLTSTSTKQATPNSTRQVPPSAICCLRHCVIKILLIH